MAEQPSGGDPLGDLGRRLEKAREAAGLDTPPSPGASGKATGAGARIGIELVSAVLVGTFLGLGLDRWLGTEPWGLVVFLFAGCIAGILNIFRAFRQVPVQGEETGNRTTGKD
ncbi:MAG: AtpZ/AtpI family protein [Pseudomonadota bacterium]|nr:AtpZ/AtpI family protein [Pseudomonadota bacterium]